MNREMISLGLFLLTIQCWIVPFSNSLVVPISAANPKKSLAGISLPRVILDGNAENQNEAATATAAAATTTLVDLSAELVSDKRTMVVFGTHAGDFNTIEYLQKIRFSYPDLRSKGGIGKILVIINGAPDQIQLLTSLLDPPESIQFLSDPTGEAGRNFGVDRGFRPDDESLSPFAKQFFTGIGIGPPWMTLPAVLPGYTGNPNGKRDWIEESLKQGQLQGRWPCVLELDQENDNNNDDDDDQRILSNKFDEAPLGLNKWGRRPFELATLRLQSLIGIQIQNWSKLKPVDDRCLTQLGGCTVVEPDGTAIYSWVDRGLCDVPDMDAILEAIETVNISEDAMATISEE